MQSQVTQLMKKRPMFLTQQYRDSYPGSRATFTAPGTANGCSENIEVTMTTLKKDPDDELELEKPLFVAVKDDTFFESTPEETNIEDAEDPLRVENNTWEIRSNILTDTGNMGCIPTANDQFKLLRKQYSERDGRGWMLLAQSPQMLAVQNEGGRNKKRESEKRTEGKIAVQHHKARSEGPTGSQDQRKPNRKSNPQESFEGGKKHIAAQFICAVCQKSCSSKGSLMIHTRLHTGEKPYKCSFCDKSFTTNGNLVVHMRVHTGERPYECRQCGKAFAQSCTLAVHIRSHTGERPYVCNRCEKAFSWSGTLREHWRRKHASGVTEIERFPPLSEIRRIM